MKTHDLSYTCSNRDIVIIIVKCFIKNVLQISHAKKLFQEWHDLLEVLDKQNIKLRTVETVGLDDTILRQELEKAQKLRVSGVLLSLSTDKNKQYCKTVQAFFARS